MHQPAAQLAGFISCCGAGRGRTVISRLLRSCHELRLEGLAVAAPARVCVLGVLGVCVCVLEGWGGRRQLWREKLQDGMC